MTPLLPCPFCGSSEVVIGTTMGKRYSVYCGGCGANGVPSPLKEGAAKSWNTRMKPVGVWSTAVPPHAGKWFRRSTGNHARWTVVDVVHLEYGDRRLVHRQGDLEELDYFEWYSLPLEVPE
jgi:Lar family restriction alleviation protein